MKILLLIIILLIALIPVTIPLFNRDYSYIKDYWFKKEMVLSDCETNRCNKENGICHAVFCFEKYKELPSRYEKIIKILTSN